MAVADVVYLFHYEQEATVFREGCLPKDSKTSLRELSKGRKMKKGILGSALVAVLLVVTLGLVGCGGGGGAADNSSVVGTWTITGMTQDGTEITEEQIVSMMGEDYLTLTFTEDGKVDGSLMGESAGMDSTYKVEGNKIFVDDDTENYFEVNGDKMTADIDGTTITLTKK